MAIKDRQARSNLKKHSLSSTNGQAIQKRVVLNPLLQLSRTGRLHFLKQRRRRAFHTLTRSLHIRLSTFFLGRTKTDNYEGHDLAREVLAPAARERLRGPTPSNTSKQLRIAVPRRTSNELRQQVYGSLCKIHLASPTPSL